MRSLAAPAIALAAVLAAAPAAAQDDGSGLMEEGAKLFLRGLMSEIDPALDEMGRMLLELEPVLREMGPALEELVRLMGDGQHYEAPVRMPNGDILIRRKPGAPPPPFMDTPEPAPVPEIDL